MKVLYVVNFVLPEIGKHLNISYNEHCGWVEEQIEYLEKKGLELSILTTSTKIHKIIEEKINNKNYFIIPEKKGIDNYEKINLLKKNLKNYILNSIIDWENEINYLLNYYNLRDKVIFLNGLNTDEMIKYYLKANVFISTSRIENESNSISEAKILGVPVISSYVRGVTSRIDHYKGGFLYPFDEPKLLAYYVDKIFNNDNLAIEISKNAIKSTNQINNPEKNTNQLIEIYKTLLSQTM